MHNRFIALKNYNKEDLEDIKNYKVAIVGLGATGSVIAENLARHGLNLILIDRDYLEEKDCYSSNLYTPEQCRKSLPKAKAAEDILKTYTDTVSYIEDLNSQNYDILDDADIILDGTDNLETRFLINEYSKKENTPWIYTAALGTQGYSMLFKDNCFNCLFDKISPGKLDTCESSGIMRETANIAASKSSKKAVEELTGKNPNENLETVSGEIFDVEMEDNCEVCRGEKFPHLNSLDYATVVCGENKYQINKEVDEKGFESIKEQATSYTENEYLLKAKIQGNNATFFKDGRAIIEAKDKKHAKSIFSETVGV